MNTLWIHALHAHVHKLHMNCKYIHTHTHTTHDHTHTDMYYYDHLKMFGPKTMERETGDILFLAEGEEKRDGSQGGTRGSELGQSGRDEGCGLW